MGKLAYYHDVEADGASYSVDMLTFSGVHQQEVLSVAYVWSKRIAFINGFYAKLRAFCDANGFLDYHYDSVGGGMFSYRDMWTIKRVSDSATVKFFFGLRSYSKSDACAWKIQFNPNKVFPCDGLVDLIGWVMARSKDARISALDFAVDFPVARSSAYMVKDKRKYQLFLASTEDRTEYLGVRGSTGFCKLYNKQIESDLSYPLTRFELSVVLRTLPQFSSESLQKLLPDVYLFDVQTTFESHKVSPSDALLVRICLEHPDCLLSLGKDKKAKIKALMRVMARHVDFKVDVWMDLYVFYVQLFNSAHLAFSAANARCTLPKDDGSGVV